MVPIPPGTRHEMGLLVTDEYAINFLGDENARVLSTPHLVAFLEWTSRNLIQPYLEQGYDTVGTHVDVKHLAAAPMGMHVRFTAELLSVNERRINCRVEAFDENEKIAEGTHERFVVNVARFAERVKAKSLGK